MPDRFKVVYDVISNCDYELWWSFTKHFPQQHSHRLTTIFALEDGCEVTLARVEPIAKAIGEILIAKQIDSTLSHN